LNFKGVIIKKNDKNSEEGITKVFILQIFLYNDSQQFVAGIIPYLKI